MEEEMYGVMLNAKIDMLVKEPPVRLLKKPRFANQPFVTSGSIAGAGSRVPSLTTINAIKV
jgi:hypothetical protein